MTLQHLNIFFIVIREKKKLIRFLVSRCDAAGKLTESVTKETTDKTGNIFFQFKYFIIRQYIDRSKAQYLPCFEFFDMVFHIKRWSHPP